MGKQQGGERVAIYARISEDPLGLERGVARQLDDGRALAKARGWTVAATFEDNDVSALNGKRRGGYEALMAASEQRQFSRIIVFHTSRLWRNRRERAEAIERLAKARVSVSSVRGPDLDLASASGRMVAGILGELDTAESELKSERVARAALQRAQEGRANGPVGYGWHRQYDTDSRGRVTGFRDVEDPTEAAIVREIVDRLLAGDSVKGITADLNARAVPGPLGRGWGSSSVRKIALRPANIAQRVHQGEVIGPAAWPTIVDPSKHARVQTLLTDPSRRTNRPANRRHLLTFGIGECGVCHGPLRVALRGNARWGTKQLLYCCNGVGCVGRRQDFVDELVALTVAERLQQEDAVDLLVNDDGDRDLMASIELRRARLADAADAFAGGTIDRQQLERITATLRAEITEAERQLTGQSPHVAAVAELASSDDIEGTFKAMPVTRQRAILEALGLRVVILRARRGPGFDPASVDLQWARRAGRLVAAAS